MKNSRPGRREGDNRGLDGSNSDGGGKQSKQRNAMNGVRGDGGYISSSSALTASAVTRHPGPQPEDLFWIDDNDPTELMTQDPVGLEEYTPASARDRVESAGSARLPVAGIRTSTRDGQPGTGNFTGPTRELELECVAHVPNLGQHNLLLMKRLA